MPMQSKRMLEKMKKVSGKTVGKASRAGSMASAKVPSTAGAAKRAAYKAASRVVRKQLVSERTPAGTAQAAAKKATPIVAMRIASDRSRAATRTRAEETKLGKAKKKAATTAARKIVGGR